MKVTAAVLRTGNGPFSVEELDLAEPRANEVLVRVVAAGMCHTDLRSRELPPEFFGGPQVYGHEGAGIVELGDGAVHAQGLEQAGAEEVLHRLLATAQ